MDQTRLDLLNRVTFLTRLPPAELQRLAERLVVCVFKRDSAVVQIDDPGDSMFFIESGRAKVVLSGSGDREVILATLGPGDFFGEMSLLDGRARSATVIAIEEARLQKLPREALIDLIRNQPEIALGLLAEMSSRLRRADAAIADLALVDVSGRVARFLLEHAELDGKTTPDGIVLRGPLTQQHIASTIGTSRETVSRALGELKRRGLVTTRGRTIVVRPALFTLTSGSEGN